MTKRAKVGLEGASVAGPMGQTITKFAAPQEPYALRDKVTGWNIAAPAIYNKGCCATCAGPH